MNLGLRNASTRPVLLAVEAAERFAYFGVLSLLPVHLSTWFAAAEPRHFIGRMLLQGGLSRIFGPLPPSALASLVFGSYTALSYVTPLLGALAADLAAGRRRMIVAGLALSLCGCLLLMREGGLLPALALLALGAGGIKANLLAQFAALAGPAAGRARGFAAYLIAVNAGALGGPLVCGWVAQQAGWRAGVAGAVVAMAGANALYLIGPTRAGSRPPARRPGRAGTPRRRRDLALVGAILIPYVLFYTAYNQAFDILPIWAAGHVDRRLGGSTAPVGWVYLLDAAFTMAAVGLFARFGRGSAREGRRVLLGCAACAAAYAGLALSMPADPRLTPLWTVVIFFLALDAGLPLVEVTTLDLLARLAPRRAEATTLALTSLCFAAANLGSGALGVLYARLPTSLFWLLHAGLAALGGLVAAGLTAPLGRARDRAEADEALAADPQPA